MKNTKKALLALTCALALVVGSVMGTMAYLQDTTEVVKNTMTVGKVGIELNEAKVNLDGTVIKGAERVKANEYKLMPGHTYTKDPMVTVDADSEESFIRMFVTITDFADVKAVLGEDFLPQNFVEGWDPAIWETTKTVVEKDNTATYEFRYHTTVDTVDAEAKSLEALFTSFTMPGSVENEDLLKLEEMEIQVVAHAIQADGFANAAAAWAAFDAE